MQFRFIPLASGKPYKMFVLLVSVLTFLLNYTGAYYQYGGPVRCPNGWTRNGNTCYLLVKYPSNWWMAVAKCSALRSDLMYVETEDEADYVGKLAVETKQWIWIGGTDEFKEDHFIWQANGKPAEITRWDKGQPNNDSTGQHHICISTNGKWHDCRYTDKKWYMCKKKMVEDCNCKPKK